MWMLMEGVVLYVALVRVFVKHQARYIIAFTVASYGELEQKVKGHLGLNRVQIYDSNHTHLLTSFNIHASLSMRPR